MLRIVAHRGVTAAAPENTMAAFRLRSDVVAYAATQRAHLAQADAVHLHPGQLSADVVATIRAAGIEVHAHSVNDVSSLELAAKLALPWICSGEPEQAAASRRARASS